MKNFNSRKNNKEVMPSNTNSDKVSVKSVLSSSNLVPLEFDLSDCLNFPNMPKKAKGSNEPIDWARSRISNLSTDEYTLGILDDEIESEIQYSRVKLSKQHNDHICAIKKIINMEKGEQAAVKSVLKMVEDEIDQYDEELYKLYDLKNIATN